MDNDVVIVGGGIAGLSCCSSLQCYYEGDYPDASGTCVDPLFIECDLNKDRRVDLIDVTAIYNIADDPLKFNETQYIEIGDINDNGIVEEDDALICGELIGS